MPKILLSLVLSTLLFTSGCTEKKNETKSSTKKAIKKETIQKETSKKEILTQEINASDVLEKKEILQPFKPTLETNITQNEPITESLEELDSSAFKTIQPRINEEMQKIPDCLERAETKEEAFACSKTLRSLNQDLAMAMGEFTDEVQKGYDDDFIWDEETKINMIKEIEASTQSMQEMQTCIEASKTPKELEACLQI